MNESLSSLSTFHLTGNKSAGDLFDLGQQCLRPALFSAYGDLSKLRYDYPLVLVKGAKSQTCLRSLTDITNEVLREVNPSGIDGERLRKHVLRLEGEIRVLAQNAHKATLFELWQLAGANLRARASDEDARTLLDHSLSAARSALRVDGEVIDYDENAPNTILTHAWSVVLEDKAREFSDQLDELTLKLSNILKADAMRSATAFDADALKQTVGSSYEAAFDFESMSDILGTAFVNGALSEKRRRRIRSVLSTLKSQKFFPPVDTNGAKGKRKGVLNYVFDRSAPALDAFQKRLPKMVELVKAMTIARLEIDSHYSEAIHDSFFRSYDERYLGADELASFPSYLIHLRNGYDARTDMVDLFRALTSGLPIKILAESDDILEELSLATGQLCFGARASQLANMALGLDDVFVLQASGSDLYRLSDSLINGLSQPGPALFSVFSGRLQDQCDAAKNSPDTPAYLRAAAATESRAFPSIVYNPAGGADWKSRFSVDANPQSLADWPEHRLGYEDAGGQKMSDTITFSFADFTAMDARYAEHFAVVPQAQWCDAMVPVNDYLNLGESAAVEMVPYIMMIDSDNELHRVVVDVRLIQAARRCRETWRRLRELADLNKSPMEVEPPALTPQPESDPQTSQAVPPPSSPPPADALADVIEVQAQELMAPPSDQAYIETPRCTTCDECTQINNKMFAYDDDKQAYIADLNAGTYRQLVDAAESCQVAIIHPGKPTNLDEPNLDELMERAAEFN